VFGQHAIQRFHGASSRFRLPVHLATPFPCHVHVLLSKKLRHSRRTSRDGHSSAHLPRCQDSNIGRDGHGVYYDIDLSTDVTRTISVKIEAEMKKVDDEKQPFLRKEVRARRPSEIIKSRGQEGGAYKSAALADIPATKNSFYKTASSGSLAARTCRYSSN